MVPVVFRWNWVILFLKVAMVAEAVHHNLVVPDNMIVRVM